MGPWMHNHFRPKLEARLNGYANPSVKGFCDVNIADGVNLTEELKNNIRDSALLVQSGRRAISAPIGALRNGRVSGRAMQCWACLAPTIR
jgi:hypothetical protein